MLRSKMESFDRVSFRTCSVLLFIILLIESVGGAVSSPIIQVVSDNSDSVVFQCESEGWYPEPEVFWLDGEGNLLTAGPTETVRGPDDLYTVSSRVTVEKRHSNNFTCRVQQKDPQPDQRHSHPGCSWFLHGSVLFDRDRDLHHCCLFSCLVAFYFNTDTETFSFSDVFHETAESGRSWGTKRTCRPTEKGKERCRKNNSAMEDREKT
ncbi:uncharacterized protein LOC119894674 [Micropterus salmoides]|uniref:uncharacterized protein LOC119894674 n=1 Tax=Micropterus salmoides TaxID=27706 RepID=UPI0018EE28AF|nr:uncharacterized protein LOC119894674 [Micropterus salmoides]